MHVLTKKNRAMKTLNYLLGIVLMMSMILSSCNKNNTPNDNQVKTMNDIVVSSNFDWKTTKTVDVAITLPTDNYSDIVSIYSITGEELYYTGYATIANVLSTRVTLPTSVTSALIVYGFDDLYEPQTVSVDGSIVLDFNSLKSTSLKNGDTGCGCDGGVFSLTMQYTGSNQSNIEVFEKKNMNRIYTGTVDPDGEFTITGGSKKDGRFDNTIYFYVDGVKNTEMHVSCSVDIEAGDIYDDFVIISGISKNNVPLCGTPPTPPPPPPPPVDPPTTTTVNLDGCLAYEDLWPGKGDYDFNDLIIDYKFNVNKDDDDYVLSITGVFTAYAYGATFHNGFGFELPNVNPNQIISVSGYEIQSGSIYSLASNGLEDNQSKATVIVYDDVYNILPHPGGTIGVNTEEWGTYVQPDSVVLHIVFFDNGSFGSGGPITYDDLDIGNFNPFIIVDQNRDVEVHLRDFAPSSLADQSILGTVEDDSDQGQSRYYTTVNNLPWAINLPVLFDYPQEKKDIVAVHLKFADWAESEGTLYTDWYMDIAGYRNESFIYTPPTK